MKFLKILFLFFVFTSVLTACEKKDRESSDGIKTDELTNTIWLGGYGQKRSTYTLYDTSFIFAMKPEGFINVYIDKSYYQNNADSLIKLYRNLSKENPDGKGFYTFDGKNFNASITLYRTGTPYNLRGVMSENKAEISGELKFNDNRSGEFIMNPDDVILK